MSQLKDHIVKQAISLFNEKGFFNVSFQQIAKALGISPGNLTYHFRRKEDLLVAIQMEILSESTVDIMPTNLPVSLLHMEELFMQFFEVQRKYSFFFSSLQYLNYEYPSIINAYKERSLSRLEEAHRLVDYYITTDRMITESERVSYDTLIQNLWTVNTFWRLKIELIGGEDNFKSAMNHIWSTILPFLTEKGYNEYLEIQTFYHKQHTID